MSDNLNAGVFPRRIEIELSAVCNLRCSYCPRKFLKELDGFMEFGLVKQIIDEAAEFPETILVLHRRGESLLHPRFGDICELVKGKFKEVQLATNATLLDDKKSISIIDSHTFISFSIDTPAVFERTRIPAKYPDVESKILRFLELNAGRVKTQVSMVKTADTPDENADEFKRIWRDKVDLVRIYQEHSRDGKFGSLAKKRSGRVPCVMPFYELLIFCDGKIGRCNHDWSGEPMGDLNGSSIKDIWNSPAYRKLRRQQQSLIFNDQTCRNCDSWYPQERLQGTGEVIKNA